MEGAAPLRSCPATWTAASRTMPMASKAPPMRQNLILASRTVSSPFSAGCSGIPPNIPPVGCRALTDADSPRPRAQTGAIARGRDDEPTRKRVAVNPNDPLNSPVGSFLGGRHRFLLATPSFCSRSQPSHHHSKRKCSRRRRPLSLMNMPQSPAPETRIRARSQTAAARAPRPAPRAPRPEDRAPAAWRRSAARKHTGVRRGNPGAAPCRYPAEPVRTLATGRRWEGQMGPRKVVGGGRGEGGFQRRTQHQTCKTPLTARSDPRQPVDGHAELLRLKAVVVLG